jgi:hypothetical protein
MMRPLQPEGSSMSTSCGTDMSSGAVMNVGAPFIKAKSRSIQFVRTDISRP